MHVKPHQLGLEREMEEKKIKCKEKFASLYSNTNTDKQYLSVLKSVEY